MKEKTLTEAANNLKLYNMQATSTILQNLIDASKLLGEKLEKLEARIKFLENNFIGK